MVERKEKERIPKKADVMVLSGAKSGDNSDCGSRNVDKVVEREPGEKQALVWWQ